MYSHLIFSPVIKLLHEECRAAEQVHWLPLSPKMRQHDILTNFCSAPKILMPPKIFLYQPPVRR